MGASVARIHTDSLIAATTIKVIAAPRDSGTKIAANFMVQALTTIIDPDSRARLEDSGRRVARDGHSGKLVDQVEWCRVVRTFSLIAGSARRGPSADGIMRRIQGPFLDRLIGRAFLLPVGWIFQGVHINTVPINGILRNSKSCPLCRRGGSGWGNWRGLDTGGHSHEEELGSNHCKRLFAEWIRINKQTRGVWVGLRLRVLNWLLRSRV